MITVIGVRFRNAGKIYYFDPGEETIARGMSVIVETARGTELGMVMLPNKEVEEDSVVQPLKPVIRIATTEDFDIIRENKKKEKEAYRICQEKIREHNLEMKLVDVEYTFDGNKILFYFTADGRIDFRELVKDLASIFKTRIELRQIGVRDETKLLGGIGICGRSLCCHSYLSEFIPVSIKMAKEQNLSLNPTKISGVCGRLMCCLKNEEDTYEYLNRQLPRIGEMVTVTEEGEEGQVQSINVLRQRVKVTVKTGNDEVELKEYPVEQLDFGPDRKPPVRREMPRPLMPEGGEVTPDMRAAAREERTARQARRVREREERLEEVTGTKEPRGKKDGRRSEGGRGERGKRDNARGENRENNRENGRGEGRENDRENGRRENRENSRGENRENNHGENRENSRGESRENSRRENRENSRRENRENSRGENRENNRGDNRENNRSHGARNENRSEGPNSGRRNRGPRSAEERQSAAKSPEFRGQEPKAPESRGPEGKGSESRGPEGKAVESRGQEAKAAEFRGQEGKSAESGAPESANREAVRDGAAKKPGGRSYHRRGHWQSKKKPAGAGKPEA